MKWLRGMSRDERYREERRREREHYERIWLAALVHGHLFRTLEEEYHNGMPRPYDHMLIQAAADLEERVRKLEVEREKSVGNP